MYGLPTNRCRRRSFTTLTMLFNRALVSSLLFAFAVLAGRPNRKAGTLNRVEESINGQYVNTTNWAGAALLKTPGTFSLVEGTFIVPGISGQNGTGASIWVGIDGATCTSAILQTGISIFPRQPPYYIAWYEWYPALAVPFNSSDISFNEGDKVRLTVAANSTTSGVAIIENLTNGQYVLQAIPAVNNSELCLQDAEWIVEDFGIEENNGQVELVPFAYFTPITFTDNIAASQDGEIYGLVDGAVTVDLISAQNKTILAAASIHNDSDSVTIVRTW
ncbi:Peptidase A4 family domain containing protein [Tylopilus felleus]